jgi:phosphoribosyl 1,2-cyclic phosphodiesterase
MRFESIASGSSGNCIYVGSDTAHLLMDVGISRKRTVDALHDLDLDLRDIDGIFITHEHSDHISGLPMIAKKSQMPIYATRGTIEAILRSDKCKEIDPERFVPIRPDEKITVKDM